MHLSHPSFFLALMLPLSSLLTQTHTSPTITHPRPSQRPLPLPVHVIHEFPKGTWIENIAVRPNDQILVSLSTSPDLYQIDPVPYRRPPILVHSFAGYTSLTGIVEVDPDVFYVVAGNFSFKKFEEFSPVFGSSSVFEVDFTNNSRVGKEETKETPAVRKVADFPTADLLNGAALLSRAAGNILLADSLAGAVWKLNVRSGAAAKVMADEPLLKPRRSSGVNGLRVRGSTLFFTNSDLETLNRVPINASGSAAGAATAIVGGLAVDDFTLDDEGQAYVAVSDATNEVVKVAVPGGGVTVLAGSPQDQATIAGPTGAAFGRGLLDRRSLYVSSTGGIQGYLGGNFTVGGRVSRIDVGSAGYYG
ncbi:MAG: hypothetical protein LQ344_005144 [Seirophora lacunosa]|nr:MAG: hypothetical protein LQ344_005144 [Seirophora lacunosa]